MTVDPADAATVPEPIRRQAFKAALVALERALDESGVYLDALGRLELLDLEMDRLERELTPPVN
jgi:hypothetical protein